MQFHTCVLFWTEGAVYKYVQTESKKTSPQPLAHFLIVLWLILPSLYWREHQYSTLKYLKQPA